MASQIKAWFALVGGLVFLVSGLLLLEPVFIGLGVVTILAILWTFRLERRTRDRYKRPAGP